MRSGGKGAVGFVGLYLGLVILLAWPLPARLARDLPATVFPCRFDTLYTTWALAYETRALATAPTRLLEANIYHPAPAPLLYGPTAFGALPFFAPVFGLTGNPVLAINLTFLLSLALTALVLHAVVQRWTGAPAAGLAAGVIFLSNRWLWRWAPSAPQYAVLLYLPAIVFLAAGPLSRRRAIGLLVLVVLQALVEPVYLTPVVLLPLATLALGRLAFGDRPSGARLAAVVVASTLVLLPLYLAYAQIRTENPSLSDQTLWRNEALMPHLLPVRVSWDGVSGAGPADIPGGLVALLVLGVLCLRLAGRASDRPAWVHATGWTLAGLLMSTRMVTLFGGASFELPHMALLERIFPSVLGTVRAPGRLGVVTAVGAAMLAGLAVDAIARAAARLRPERAVETGVRVALAAAVMLVAYRDHREAMPAFTVEPAPSLTSPVLEALRREDGPLVELPVDPIRTGVPGAKLAEQQARAMFHSIAHWRPLLNGYASYWPAGFPERMAVAARLPDAAALRALRATTGLSSVLVNVDDLMPSARTRWLALSDTADASGLRLVARDDRTLLFDVDVSGRSERAHCPNWAAMSEGIAFARAIAR
jgi:hypothetical protein